MSLDAYTHWIGIVPVGTPTTKEAPRGAAVVVLGQNGRLATRAACRVPYVVDETDGLDLLRQILDGDWAGRPEDEWEPLVVLDRFSPHGRASSPSSPARGVTPHRVFAAGVIRGILEGRGVDFVCLSRTLWADVAALGTRHPGKGGDRDSFRLAAAQERWPGAFKGRADLAYAEAALMAEVARLRFRDRSALSA